MLETVSPFLPDAGLPDDIESRSLADLEVGLIFDGLVERFYENDSARGQVLPVPEPVNPYGALLMETQTVEHEPIVAQTISTGKHITWSIKDDGTQKVDGITPYDPD